ncbi:Alcohol dehydrogenase [Bertholletia excelsa]
MLYASLCHTDILCAKGILGVIPVFPRVLGHEGVGVVESVGDEVTDMKEGDVVVPTFLGECKVCENCKSGKTNVCPTYPMSFSGLMLDGTSRMRDSGGQILHHLFSCSTWSEYTVVDANYAIKIDPNKVPLQHASLLSCGFSSGFGAPWKEAKVEPGSSVAVFGLGTVGFGAIEGARVQGATKIIGIDKNKLKGEKGKAFGMTDFIDPTESDKPISELVKEVTGGRGVDYCIECTGVAPLLQEALESTKPGTGTTVMIGAGNSADISYQTILMGRTLKGSSFGGIKTKSELPIVVDNCITKGVQLNELLTHEISLEDANKAFDLLKQPDCIKVLIKI